MAEFIKVLSGMLGRPIIDQTNFTGKFDLNLRFSYEAEVTTGISNPYRTADGDPSGNPTITEALQRQIGLRLVSGKAPVEILIIDHAEKPSEN